MFPMQCLLEGGWVRAGERPAAGVVERAEGPVELGGPGSVCRAVHEVFAIGVMLGQGIIVERKVQTKRLLASNPDLTGNPLVI